MSSIGALAGPCAGLSPVATFWRGGSSEILHGRLRLELIDVGLIGGRAPLLRQERLDRLAHLLDRGALHARLIGRVPRRDVRVGHGLNLRRDFLIDERRARHSASLGFDVDELLARQLVDRRPPCLVQRQHQLHRAELAGGCCIAFRSTSASVIDRLPTVATTSPGPWTLFACCAWLEQATRNSGTARAKRVKSLDVIGEVYRFTACCSCACRSGGGSRVPGVKSLRRD